MDLVFTDLDGTLLDHDTYSWEAARPALTRLRELGIAWIFVTSKTRAEVDFWRTRLENDHPFIVENGGAAYVPDSYFPFRVAGVRRQGWEVLEWGTAYTQLVADLQLASEASQCRVRAFHELTVEEVADECQLPLEQAALAMQREYDEPFVLLDPERTAALLAAIESQGRRWTRGGRFWHILGSNDKKLAVSALIALYEQTYGPVRTIGLGDGLNDTAFLELMAEPVVIRSPQAQALQARLPQARVTAQAGPAGWNDAILSLVDD